MIQIAVIVSLLLVVAIGVQTMRVANLESHLNTLQNERAAIRALHAAETQRALDETKQAELQILKEHADAVEQAKRDAMAARVRANELDRVAGRLRDHLQYLATSGSAGTEIATVTYGGEAATSTGLVLAQLYRSADEEAVELAGALDAAHAAGQLCERLYTAAVSAK